MVFYVVSPLWLSQFGGVFYMFCWAHWLKEMCSQQAELSHSSNDTLDLLVQWSGGRRRWLPQGVSSGCRWVVAQGTSPHLWVGPSGGRFLCSKESCLFCSHASDFRILAASVAVGSLGAQLVAAEGQWTRGNFSPMGEFHWGQVPLLRWKLCILANGNQQWAAGNIIIMFWPKSTTQKRYLLSYFHCSIIHNSQNMEAIQMSKMTT